MNLWGPAFFDNTQLEAEIRQYAAARRQVGMGETAGFKSVAGEGRRIEFGSTKDQRDLLDADLRNMLAEARKRGMAIGGCDPSAIAVEIG